MCCYDLHSHSTASDGTLAPAQLVRAAREAGVGVLAL
ncbi:MAG: phosphatase, partial [Thiogranum sp.]